MAFELQKRNMERLLRPPEEKELEICPQSYPALCWHAQDSTWVKVERGGATVDVGAGLSLYTQNVWFAEHRNEERWPQLLRLVRESAADVVALQEVTRAFLSFLCQSPHIRRNYAVSDASASSSDEGGDGSKCALVNDSFSTAYGCILLVSLRIRPQTFTLVPLPSRQGRGLLCCQVGSNLVVTSHLESEVRNRSTRIRQLKMARAFFKQVDEETIIFCGDFNIGHSDWSESKSLDPSWVDVALPLGPTCPATDQYPPARFDRVYVCKGASGCKATNQRLVGNEAVMESLKKDTSSFEYLTPSDHYGIVVNFSLLSEK